MPITIIFAPPRTGKTSFMTHLLNTYAFDRSRTKSMQKEIARKNNSGFNLSIPQHTVSANYDITFHKFGYSPRKNRKINPYRLGFKNKFVETHFNIPFEVIGITEVQQYLNSRMSKYFPSWQSRWYEQHGHDNIDILMDTHRPMLVDVNVRDLASFIEIISLKLYCNRFGRVNKMKWVIRRIANSSLFERYMASGKRDKRCYRQETVIANYNVFDCYSSQSCKPKFYDGHFDEDFDYTPSKPVEENIEGYIKFLEENDDELPKGFYQIGTTRRKENA